MTQCLEAGLQEVIYSYVVLLVDLLKAASWPLALLITAALFKRPVLKLLSGKDVSLEAGGLKIAVKEAQIAKTDQTPAITGSAVSKIDKSQAVHDVESWVRTNLEGIPVTDREEILINWTAKARLTSHSAIVYLNIFGSQIRALQNLNEQGGVATLEEAKSYFNEVKGNYAELSDWTFERYVAYLKNNLLIAEDETSIRLTPIGKEFISFLINFGLPTSKPL